MKLVIVAVFDSKLEAFMPPIFVRTEGEAIRAFRAQLVNPETDFSKFAEDYTLFELGSYEDSKGEFTNLPTPRSLVTAFALKASIKEGN